MGQDKSSKKAMDIIFDAGQRPGLGWFEPANLAIVPAALPLSYTLKPKSLARKVSWHSSQPRFANESERGQRRKLSGGTSKLVRLM